MVPLVGWHMVIKPQAEGHFAGNWQASAAGWAKAIRQFPAGERLTRANLNHDDLILSGWVGLGKSDLITDGLIGVLLPGDRLGAILDGSCCGIALTPISLTSDEADACGHYAYRHLVRQCIRTGHLGAVDRVEDFLLEIYERLEAVGLASEWSFDFPLTQSAIGNILGLSTEHVNRVVKKLQAEKRIQVNGRTVTILSQIRVGRLARHAAPL